MMLDALTPLRETYPTFRVDMWTHRTAAREIVKYAPPDVVARVMSGRDPLVAPELVSEMHGALFRWGGAAEQRHNGAQARPMVG